MEFFTRLLGGQRKQAAPNNPQQRLARFKQRYNSILQTWQKTQTLATDREALGNIRRGFQALTAILNDESRSPAPHLCLSFAAAQQIYTAVSKIAATSHDEGMVRDAVAVYSALIDSEEEDFLENDVFAASLMNFIGRTVGSSSMGVGEDIEADIVELLFGITTKIRLQPEILPVWFTTTSSDAKERAAVQKVDFAGITQKEDFPLCYQLIDHVHHEGRIGDFARTGLLYIFESASKSTTLEQWIVNSDLPTFMATGLGALYSQLSRKLSILHTADTEDLPLILKLSDYREMQANPQAVSFFSEDFQGHMATFLSYLAFWQDVLEHCRSVDVRLTLIDHFQILFLQQLLYPSLLESSDIDGGSSVAVLTYLRRILDALDHPELIHMILHYLLALPDFHSTSTRTPKSPAALKRHQSLLLLQAPDKDEEKMNPSLFNLVDLVLGSTDSQDSQTVIAALKLTTVILAKNHGYALGSLIKYMAVHHKEPYRTIGALNVETELYLSIAISLAGEIGVDEAYENHLKDKLSLLEGHPCSLKALALPNTTTQNAAYLDGDVVAREVEQHYLMPEDPLYHSLLSQLLMFLTNDVETNLALTEVITTLGSCSQLRLEGWLSVDPAEYVFQEGEDELADITDDVFRNMYRANRRPTWSPSAAPQLLACLQQLESQVEALRADIQDWDEHVANRKHVFQTYEEMSEVSKNPNTSVKQPTEPPPGSWTPQIPKHLMDSSTTPSRVSSPRGRKEGLDAKHTPASSPTPSRLGRQVLGGSPRGTSPLPAPQAGKRQTTFMADVLSNLADVNNNPNLKRRIRFRKPAGSQTVEVMLSKYQPPPKEPTEDDDTAAVAEEEADDVREASLGHIITNVVILQEFILELVALLQVRASLFGEVRHA
ncbi:hypothetical protein BU24DRAFT_491735 [Aaosphaeria arxii CBS 175.79]|uniref:FHF complex subunit HOOK-interacting protein C-terminal domain-containing protein n=1 Tax=Aaosphaeria arxii CBS 175.79 TaxID=1450172 RepID=A0A6A5XRM9_9PLEO|nr:uncharacterized protein BU24DRAFT_491735 [Aaosphaeria arxii CBS 175.79]KAF2015497.1 hypothetical protein BU24DRAFT_491735 [Aaosphaeria arxii CBS 175.79]